MSAIGISSRAALCVLLLATVTSLAPAAIAAPGAPISEHTWQIEIDPRPQDYFEHISYRMWVPPGLARVRGLLVFEHGCGYGAGISGLRFADDLQYQALARKWNLAIVTARQYAPGENCWVWMNIEHGSADAFLGALVQLAKASEHPEVATVRWALWGHSGGGAWVTAMTARYPERVIATHARSGAFGTDGNVIGPGAMTLKPSAAMRQVPMLFCYGAKEEYPPSEMADFIAHLREVYQAGQKDQARWAVAVDPFTGHENGDTRLLAIRFFDTIFAQTSELGGTESSAAWQGDPRSLELAAPGAALKASGDLPLAWLPSREFALRWQEFGRTGRVRDLTAPPAPTEVTSRTIADGSVIAWRATADLESGIQEFRIYGDGELLGRRRSYNPEGDEAPFQYWNYHDQPAYESEQNPMRFAWRGAPRRVYTVTSINHFGLESAPSVPATPAASN